MAKFTKADDITVPQSVGPYTGGDVNYSSILGVFEPYQGRNLLYYNPNHIYFPILSTPFSLNIKGDSVEDISGNATGPTQYEVYVNDNLIVTEASTSDSFQTVDFPNIALGKEPTLPDIIEIKIREVNACRINNYSVTS